MTKLTEMEVDASPSPTSPADDVAGLIERLDAKLKPDEEVGFAYCCGSAPATFAELRALLAALSRLQTERNAAIRSADAVCDSYAAENQRLFDRAEASDASAATMREALNIDAAVYAAALTWCGEKDRETFPEDITYFKCNWSSLPGLEAYVDRELGKRYRAALGGHHG